MRRYKRAILRHRAEKRGAKASRYVREAWDRLQRKKLGDAERLHNVAHGTKPKRLWRSRVA